MNTMIVGSRKQLTATERLSKANEDNARLRNVITGTTRRLADGEYVLIGGGLYEAFEDIVDVVGKYIVDANHERWKLMESPISDDKLDQIVRHERDMCVGAITDWVTKLGGEFKKME